MDNDSYSISDLVERLASSVGHAKADAVVREASARAFPHRQSFTHLEAMRILDAIAKVSGLVGVSARFAKSRCILDHATEKAGGIVKRPRSRKSL